MRTKAAAFLAIIVAAGPAMAERPLSAIEWLSDVIATPAVPEPDPSVRPGLGGVAPIVTETLGSLVPDGVGLISAEASGLPADLWGASSSTILAETLVSEPVAMPAALRDLLKRVLLAELDPPRDADLTGALLLARIDRLLTLGALEEAGALLELAGDGPAELFRRRFDVALLTGNENAICEDLLANPEILPTYPARIFCLARSGDWHTAAVTLETANALGLLDGSEDALLARFIHPELAEELPRLDAPPRPSPLVFRLFESIGEPLPTGTMPVAFAHSDLRPTVGWKAQIEAAERLARTGAVDPNLLLGLYTERRPSASGGVWDRAAAIQALDRALQSGDPIATEAAFRAAWDTMRAADLGVPFARAFAERLARATANDPGLRAEMIRVAILGGAADKIMRAEIRAPFDQFLHDVATGRVPASGTDPALSAIRDGLTRGRPPERLATLAAENRSGEALLQAIGWLAEPGTPDENVADALAYLRFVGLGDAARRIAVERLLLGPVS